MKLDDELDVQVCATVDGKSVTRGQMAVAFDAVKNGKHWKYPVDAIVSFTSTFERLLLAEAIVFFTGSVPSFEIVRLEANRSVYRVRAAGYFATCGA